MRKIMADLLLELLAIAIVMGTAWGILEISYDVLFEEEEENEFDPRD
jgi:hypothetical protein